MCRCFKVNNDDPDLQLTPQSGLVSHLYRGSGEQHYNTHFPVSFETG